MATPDFSAERLAWFLDSAKALDAAIQLFSTNPPACELETAKWALLLPYMSASLERSRLAFVMSFRTNCTEAAIPAEVSNG